jgi:methylated-DNA-protein-cysteine methyltransferase-like protein
MDEARSQLFAWLLQVPHGRVVTYGQLAALAGRPQAARWVGRELARLPRSTLLPWHRVVNARGASSLPQDADGCNLQLRLLQQEGVTVVDGRVALQHWRWDPAG